MGLKPRSNLRNLLTPPCHWPVKFGSSNFLGCCIGMWSCTSPFLPTHRNMAPRRKSRFWRGCRFCFRQFRICVWLVLLVLAAILVYVNQVGLPDFIKKPLLQSLHERGLDLQFSRLRLRWYRGIVADNVRFERAGEPFSPQLTLREVQVRLNHEALRKFQIQI